LRPTLNLEAPCIPIEGYASAVRQHVEAALSEFQADRDARPAEDKYVALESLFMSAHISIIACTAPASGTGQVNSDRALDLAKPYAHTTSVASSLKFSEKPWSDDDIQLLIRGLNGADLYEDVSWLTEAMEQNFGKDRMPCEED
jgi:hypothetical protein